jgi:hypothetical protein
VQAPLCLWDRRLPVSVGSAVRITAFLNSDYPAVGSAGWLSGGCFLIRGPSRHAQALNRARPGARPEKRRSGPQTPHSPKPCNVGIARNCRRKCRVCGPGLSGSPGSVGPKRIRAPRANEGTRTPSAGLPFGRACRECGQARAGRFAERAMFIAGTETCRLAWKPAVVKPAGSRARLFARDPAVADRPPGVDV